MINEVKVLNQGEKFAHASVGHLHGFEGKLFVKEAIGATSCEISFGSLLAGEAVPFSTATKKMRKSTLSSVAREGFKSTMKCLMWQKAL